MTVYNRGDVVLVAFVFSDKSTKKLRPTVVISFVATIARGKKSLSRLSRATSDAVSSAII